MLLLAYEHSGMCWGRKENKNGVLHVNSRLSLGSFPPKVWCSRKIYEDFIHELGYPLTKPHIAPSTDIHLCYLQNQKELFCNENTRNELGTITLMDWMLLRIRVRNNVIPFLQMKLLLVLLVTFWISLCIWYCNHMRHPRAKCKGNLSKNNEKIFKTLVPPEGGILKTCKNMSHFALAL